MTSVDTNGNCVLSNGSLVPKGLGIFFGQQVHQEVHVGHLNTAYQRRRGNAALPQRELIRQHPDGLALLEEVVEGVIPNAGTGNEDAVLDEEEGNAIALASQVCRHVVHIAGIAVLEGVAGFNKQVVGQETPPQGGQAPSWDAAVGCLIIAMAGAWGQRAREAGREQGAFSCRMDLMEQGFQDYFFDRVDGGDDALFYREPRLVVHIDDDAIAEIGRIFEEFLPANGVILDLMSSWRSHLPKDFVKAQMVGLGLNAVEMLQNFQLDEYVVHDVNKEPRLPFDDAGFDGVILTVSVQYLTRPVEVLRDVCRILKPGGALVITFSNRMFPTKAVRIWQGCSDEQRMTLVKMYLQRAGGFEGIRAEDRSPLPKGYSDPVYLVTGRRAGAGFP